MESTEHLQQQEITVLKSIYDADFLEPPPPKAWRGAARLPEFIIKVSHPDQTYASKVFFHLNTKFPKTYPIVAWPVFTVQQPIQGFSPEQITNLNKAIAVEAESIKGTEMVFQIVTFAQDWMESHVIPPKEVPGSLATQMNQRALDEEQARRLREAAEAEQEYERAVQEAEQLNEQIRVDAHRQQLVKEQQYRARKRAQSDATEVPSAGDTPTESFGQEMEMNGLRFDAVKIFHPRKECLGTTYLADPVCDDVHATLPLELHVIEFDTFHYTTSPGRRKLKQLETELQRLTAVRHPNLLSLFAVKLNMHQSSDPPRLVILSEQRPPLSLQDVLEDCESLREERTSDYLKQILGALEAVHAAGLVHRGLSPRCIYLATRDGSSSSKLVKVGKVAFHVRLLDIYRSNPFGPKEAAVLDEGRIPETWMPKEVVDSPLNYSTVRDIHSVGIVLLQMLLGYDVTERYVDFQVALNSVSISPTLQRRAMSMLMPRKSVTCSALLVELRDASGNATTRTLSISIAGSKPPAAINYSSSPEMDYFKAPPPRPRQASRWKEDWEELELLGKGAFGSVVKARNKIDSRIYAVKKIRLRTAQSDKKIFREVNALSRLSHRFVVRYYTTWVETSEPLSNAASDDNSDSATEDGMTSIPHSKSRGFKSRSGTNDGISIDLNDLDNMGSDSRSSFPSIHFSSAGSKGVTGSDESDSDEPFGNLFVPDGGVNLRPVTPPPPIPRTLYIQMEFVERQTLKERVAEGISETEAWRLFHQIVDALVHMSGLGILHRDIKLTNIFIDGKGDCKVGDFGLATSSLAAVDPSDLSPHVTSPESDMTLEVGTRLYISPEVQSRKRGPRNHAKADMYSLGIVFFEMNFTFSTGSERIAVIEDLRKPEIFFPTGWELHRTRQRQIITQLLQHDPADRPTALELSQSPLLPPRVEDEYFKSALRLMAKPDSPHHQAVVSSLFNQPPRPVRGFLYDLEAELPEHAALNDTVQDRLATIFRLHGAVDMEPPLLMPVTNLDEHEERPTFLDRHGDIVALPSSALVPFARLAARGNIRRIKRYHIADIYRPNAVAGHPKVTKAAVFDIITPDLVTGPIASAAELLSIVNDCLNSFPNLAQTYDVHISHSRIVDLALNRVPQELRVAVIDIINQSKSSSSQKRALLLKKGLLRSTADELDVLGDVDEDIDAMCSRLEKASPTLLSLITPAIDEIKKTIQYANTAGFTRPVFFHPLMLGSHHASFKDGVRFEVVRRNKRIDVLAAGGRYDDLISTYSPPTPNADPICAYGVQIALEKITIALAAFQSSSVKTLVKEQRSFGFWSPRRCDVYVVSYHPGYLQDRLEVAALLWQHNISADVMYESGLPDADLESHVDACAREGILFIIYPRPRTARRDQPAFKVKSVLRGTEHEVSRQELVGWLNQQIAEQKRIDASTSGAPAFTDSSQIVTANKDIPGSSDVQLILPGDAKKQRKQTKQLFLDRAFDMGIQVKSAMQSGMPVLAVDVPVPAFDALTRSPTWITDDDAWRAIVNTFPTQHSAYAHQVREGIAKRRSEGHHFILLFAVREERVHLLTLS